jgi:SNF2 family DNA or RNA helicase
VLLFSQFVSMLKIIRTKLEEMKLPFHWLTGASTDRASIVKAFQEDENASVFLLSLKAGGSGLNLTSASYVILYDPWWNPAVENQAIDRAHRIGQTQPVIAYRMLTRSTIEEKIMTLQQKKNLIYEMVSFAHLRGSMRSTLKNQAPSTRYTPNTSRSESSSFLKPSWPSNVTSGAF